MNYTKNRNPFRLLVSTVAVVVLCLAMGCSTPASRIRQNQTLFNTYPSDAQRKIQQGQIDIGFTRDMVDMALGAPNRTYHRKTATAEITVLAFTRFEAVRDRQRIEADVRFRDANGTYRTVHDWVWVDVEHRNEYDRLRVELTNGKVSAIETMAP